MVNIFFEIERLRITLINKGIHLDTINDLVSSAEARIYSELDPLLNDALDRAISVGTDARSVDFINDLVIDRQMCEIRTLSGMEHYREPAVPMLDKLLRGAKPMKNGGGVYKTIPVGGPSKRPSIASNIFDAQKRISVEREEKARAQYANIAPAGSKVKFRTATSKQSYDKDWVLPAKENDFSEDLHSINKEIEIAVEDIVKGIIREFEENY